MLFRSGWRADWGSRGFGNSQDPRTLGSKGESQTEPDRPGGGLSEPQSLQLYNGRAHTSVPQRFNKTKSKGRLILVSTKKNVQR